MLNHGSTNFSHLYRVLQLSMFFLLLLFYSSSYRIFTEYPAQRSRYPIMSFSLTINLTPIPPKKTLFITSHNSLCVSIWNHTLAIPDWRSLLCPKSFCIIFVSFGYTGERPNPRLRRKDWILWASLLEVKSFWPQKVRSRGQIYPVRSKLMLISDQTKDFVKNCLESRGSMSPFQNRWFTCEILN